MNQVTPKAKISKQTGSMKKGAGFTSDNSLAEDAPKTRQMTGTSKGSMSQPINDGTSRTYFDEKSSRPDIKEKRSMP